MVEKRKALFEYVKSRESDCLKQIEADIMNALSTELFSWTAETIPQLHDRLNTSLARLSEITDYITSSYDELHDIAALRDRKLMDEATRKSEELKITNDSTIRKFVKGTPSTALEIRF